MVGPFQQSLARRLVAGLARVGVVLKSQGWQLAAGRGLSPTQAQILSLLRLRFPRGARLVDLADELAITPATASDAVRALLAKQLVRKERAAEDGRARLIQLTPAGARLAEDTAGWPDFLLAAVEALDAEEQRVLLRALVKIIRQLQERGLIAPARMCVGCRFFRPYAHPDMRRPHHCLFVDAPFGDGELRLDCPDFQPAPPDEAARLWTAFCAAGTTERAP